MNDYNWWQRAVIYEVYVRSFRDSDGDGVGDLPGVIEKLPYLQDLGVDAIWLTPFYKSPMVDNGYDVSDYDHVDPLFGTDEDFGRLVAEAHARGIKVVIDIVVNHTSSEHPWFRESRSSKDSPKRDWYLWTSAPNEWRAVFGGPAWNYDETTGEYYLGLFSKAQPDLNWNNPEVRAEVKAMMRRWAARGVDGFRLDVISLIAKPDGLLNGTLENADLSASGDWHSLIANRDETHSFIHELHRDVFAPCGLMTVGETSAVTLAEALRYSGRTREELSMVFQFEHVGLDGSESWKWTHGRIPVPELKEVLYRWQEGLADDGWNGLFWCNHDQPRIVSRLGDEGVFRERSAKMLATCLHGMKGTPFVYQGEELGMTNVRFSSVEELQDIESIQAYEELTSSGRYTPEEMLSILSEKSRDNARTPMPWDFGENAEAQVLQEDSVRSYYKELISLRHENDCLAFGSFRRLTGVPDDVFAYLRVSDTETLLVVCNFSAEVRALDLPEWKEAQSLIGNVPDSRFSETGQLEPYEAAIFSKA